MNYNYVLTTGKAIGSPFLTSRNKKATWNSEQFVLNESFRTGRKTVGLFANSQALLEEEPEITVTTNSDVYSVSTGDFYLKTEAGFNSKTLFFDGLTEDSNDLFSYDVKSGFDYGVATGVNTTDMADNLFNDMVSKTLTGSSFDLFINGQKLNENVSFITGGSGDYVVFTISGAATGISGKMFAYEKKPDFFEVISEQPDYIGLEFLPSQLDFFVNGMRQTQEDLLCLYSGTSVIETGKQAQNIFRSFESSYYNL